MLKCNIVMTKDPECCLPGDSVARAAQLMRQRNVGAIPVVESKPSGKLVGIVTDRDLALHVVADECDPSTTPVSEVMTRNVFTCQAEDDFTQALDLMAEHKLRRIPIVDGGGQLIGIISQADIATRVDEPDQVARVVKGISQPHVEPDEFTNRGHQEWASEER